MARSVGHLLLAVALLAGAFALLRTFLGQLVLAGLAGAFLGSFASVYAQLRGEDWRR